jgi:hypothetical protein
MLLDELDDDNNYIILKHILIILNFNEGIPVLDFVNSPLLRLVSGVQLVHLPDRPEDLHAEELNERLPEPFCLSQ